MFHGLAAMLLDHSTARGADRELPVDIVEGVDDKRAEKDLNQAGKLERSHIGGRWVEGRGQ